MSCNLFCYLLGGDTRERCQPQNKQQKIQPSPAKKIKTQGKPGVNSKCVFRHFGLKSRRRGIDIIFSGERAKPQKMTQAEENYWLKTGRMYHATIIRERAEYMQSRKWSITREGALDHYGRKCADPLCGETEFLAVHHFHYDNWENEPLEDLIPLCRGHHKWVHFYTKNGRIRLADALAPCYRSMGLAPGSVISITKLLRRFQKRARALTLLQETLKAVWRDKAYE